MSHKPPTDTEQQELAILSHARSYTAPGVRVFSDRGRYLHFAECVRFNLRVANLSRRKQGNMFECGKEP